LQINPNLVEALANLGNALVHQNQLEEAVTCYRRALQIDPRDAVIHFNLSIALNRQGKSAEAQAEWEEAKRCQVAKAVSR